MKIIRFILKYVTIKTLLHENNYEACINACDEIISMSSDKNLYKVCEIYLISAECNYRCQNIMQGDQNIEDFEKIINMFKEIEGNRNKLSEIKYLRDWSSYMVSNIRNKNEIPFQTKVKLKKIRKSFLRSFSEF